MFALINKTFLKHEIFDQTNHSENIIAFIKSMYVDTYINFSKQNSCLLNIINQKSKEKLR